MKEKFTKETMQYILFYLIIMIVGVINLIQSKISPIAVVLSIGLLVYGIIKISDCLFYTEKNSSSV